MSLDVTLLGEENTVECICSECGHKHSKTEREMLFDANITHNLTDMAEEAGIYEACWRPYRLHPDYKEMDDYDEEYEFEIHLPIQAKDIIPLLEKGLADLKARPKYFKKFDASNGWGTYEHFVPWVSKYLEACKENPNAIIETSR